MPNWKKVVVSGSSPTLSGLTSDGNVEITGSLKVSGSIDIEMPSGSVFTIHEGDANTNYKNRLDFFYDDQDPTLEIASRAATSTLVLSKDGGGSYSTTLTGLGKLNYKAAGVDYGVQLGTAFKPVATNQQDLGFYNRRWKNLYLYSSNKIGWGTTNASEHAAFTHIAGTGTITLASDVYTPSFELDGPITASSFKGDNFVKSGGTSTEFLKADGSVDSSTYLTSLTGAVLTSGDQTASGTKTFSGTVKISNAVNAGFDTNKFLVLDTTDKIDFRTGAEVRADIDAAADGANSDITSLSGLTTALSVGQGGTGVTSLDSIALSEFDDDLSYIALTGNQSAAGTKTFTGQIVIGANGSTSAPMIRFPGTLTNTGFYASNPDEISITRAGSQAFKFDSNGFQQLVAGGTSQFAGHLQAHCLGIGGTPSTTSGEIWAYGDIVANKSSDRRLKKYIKNIKNPLEKLSKINGVTFEWKKTDEKMKKEVHSHEGHDVGVIAQEIEEILPEIVATRDNGYKAVYYEKLIPLLIESVKELKAEVDELKKFK